MLCGFTDRERHTLPSMLGVLGVFSALRCYWSVRHTCMHWLRTKISVPTLLSWTVLLLCRQTNRLSSSGVPIHQTGADQSSPAGPLAACLCLFAPARNLAVLHLAVTQLQSHLAFAGKSPERLMSSRSVEPFHRCGGTANGTSRHFLTGPVLSWLDRSSSDIVQSSNFFPPRPLRLLWNVMPYLVSMCVITIILPSIHSFPQCPL